MTNLRSHAVLASCLLWATLIFLTSCTVIRPQEFFDWIHSNLLIDDGIFQRFQIFWGLSWYAVVKGWHFLEFAILFRLCLAAIGRLKLFGSPTKAIGLAIFISVIFAVSDEWHQTFVPERGGVASDVLIDGLGIFSAAWMMIRRHRLDLSATTFRDCQLQPIMGHVPAIPIKD